MFAQVRRDEAKNLIGLLKQERIHLQCRPVVQEFYNNDPTDLDLEIHDGFAQAISVRNFILGGGPKCVAAIEGVPDDFWYKC